MNENNQHRGPWYILTGIIIGFIAGLIYTSWIAPVRLTNTIPSILSSEAKDDYRIMVANAYAADRDLGRARARILLLGDDNIYTALLDTANAILESGGSSLQVQALEDLAGDMKSGTVSNKTTGTLEVTPTVTVTPGEDAQDSDTSGSLDETKAVAQAIQTATPAPTSRVESTGSTSKQPQASLTAAPEMDVAFVLLKQDEVCDTTLPGGLIQVMVEDTEGDPLAGVPITITWDDTDETFYSGLFPQISLGYADYLMNNGQRYWLQVGKGGEQVSDLEIPVCSGDDGATYDGGWLFYFAARERVSG